MSDHVPKQQKADGESGSGAQSKGTSPKKTCDFSTQSFCKIIDTAAFVDKTLFIKTFLEAEDTVIITTAPDGFGKSTTLDMVKEFLLGNRTLFEDNKLKIYEEEREFFDKNCVKNPVIHVDMRRVWGCTEDKILNSMKRMLSDAYGHHRYLLKEAEENWVWSDKNLDNISFTVQQFVQYWQDSKTLSRDEVIVGFKRLSECLHVYHDKPVYILIDELDRPLIKAIQGTDVEDLDLTEIINLFGDIMSKLFKDNNNVKRGLIMACTPIAEVLFGDTNKMKCYTLLSESAFLPYFGFTNDEVKNLFDRNEFAMFKDDKVDKWYMINSDARIYNSYSILKYLEKSRDLNKKWFGNLNWIGNLIVSPMENLFMKIYITHLIDDLIKGKDIIIETIPKYSKGDIITLKSLICGKVKHPKKNEAHLFLQFLIYIGFFNVVKYNRQSSEVTVKVPSIEMQNLLKERRSSACLNQRNLEAVRIEEYQLALDLVLKYANRNAFIRLAKAVSELFDGDVMPTLPCNDAGVCACLYVWGICSYLTVIIEEIEREEIPSQRFLFIMHRFVGLIMEVERKSESPDVPHTPLQTEQCCEIFDKHNITNRIWLSLQIDESKLVTICYSVNGSHKETVTSEM